MQYNIQKIKMTSKCIFFSLLYIFNVFNLYFFGVRAWRIKDIIRYTDANYKGYLDMIELYFGYIGGWFVLFMLSLVYSVSYIRNKPFYAFVWLSLPIFYLGILMCHEYL
jgi:hypothetical protein